MWGIIGFILVTKGIHYDNSKSKNDKIEIPVGTSAARATESVVDPFVDVIRIPDGDIVFKGIAKGIMFENHTPQIYRYHGGLVFTDAEVVCSVERYDKGKVKLVNDKTGEEIKLSPAPAEWLKKQQKN